MNTMIFRGAEFRHSDLVAEEKGPVLLAVHFRSDLTDEVIESMEWEPIPLCVASAHKLTGELACNTLTITPNDEKLRHLERVIDVDSVEDFRAFPIKDDNKEVCGHGLEWVARISHADSILAFISIALPLGRASLRADVSYNVVKKTGKPAGVDDGSDGDENQPSLGFDGNTEEAGGQFVQAESDELIPEVLITETAEVPLATAREAVGGTHAKRGPGRPRKVAPIEELPSVKGDGESIKDVTEKCIQGDGDGWSGTIMVLDLEGVLRWSAAVKILGGPMTEGESKGEPPLSIPAAVCEAAEYVAEWADYQMESPEKQIRFQGAQIRSWALNTKADNRPAESSIRVARGGK